MTTKRRTMPSRAVQVRLDLKSIGQGVVCFGSGDRAEYCAVIEVAGSQESLAKVDDAKQEELLAAYAQFLNSLTFPFQLVVQVHPVDLSWYVARVEERARTLSPGLVAIARDHAAFVQGLTKQRTLLERRIFIVVPWSRPEQEAGGNDSVPFLRIFTFRRSGRGAADARFRVETINRQLNDRCEAIGRQLGRAGLRATRLDDLGLARLYHASWAPEISRMQRLRQELADYTTLVVGGQRGSGPASSQRPFGLGALK
jgi:hypothetical protein